MHKYLNKITVDWSFARENNADQLETLESRLEVAEHRLDLVGASGIFAKAWLANDGHSSVITYLLQLLGEVPECVFSNSALWGKASNSPYSDLHTSKELLATHVPYSLIGQCLLLRATTVLELWRRKNTTAYLHHAVGYCQSKLLNVRIVIEVCLANQVVDLTLAIWG